MSLADTWRNLTKANRAAGAAAFAAGEDVDTCPYMATSPAAVSWHEGWALAAIARAKERLGGGGWRAAYGRHGPRAGPPHCPQCGDRARHVLSDASCDGCGWSGDVSELVGAPSSAQGDA